MIEKLGITPGPWVITKDPYHQVFSRGECVDLSFGGSNMNMILTSPEILEALIDMCLDMEQYGNRWVNAERIIEKATGLTWTEVKERIE